MGKKLTRRDFLKLLWVGFINFILIAMGGTVFGFFVEPRLFKVENIRLKLKRLPAAFSGIRVAQISDIHIGGWMNRDRLKEVADLLQKETPEVLLITGDFLIGHQFNETSQKFLQDLIDVFSPLAKSIPTFAVLGNHDYWTNIDAVRQMLVICGINDLTNSVFTLTRDGTHLHLCGVDDWWEGKPRLGLITKQIGEEGAAILLAHEPDFADKSAATGRFDLQISGHTHGGQIVFPFMGPPVLPHLGRKYPSGLYTIGEMYQYTNRGIGMARFPFRWNCRPEITIFEFIS